MAVPCYKKYAVIDVGTNSVRLLLAEVSGERIITSEKFLSTPRIGEGLQDGLLQDDAMLRTAEAVSDYADVAREYGAAEIFCFATNAVRSAVNNDVFSDMTANAASLRLHILTGEQEALAGFTGAAGFVDDTLLIDIGGGSTEIILGGKGKINWSNSYETGGVRLLNRFGDYAPASRDEYVGYINGIFDGFGSLDVGSARLIGIGGTVTTAASVMQSLTEYSPELIQGCPLTRDYIDSLLDRLGGMTRQQRRRVVGLDPDRADIICYGLAILVTFMKHFDLNMIEASDRDNLEGYLLLRLSGYFNK